MKLIIVLVVTVLATLAKAKNFSEYTPNNIYVLPKRPGKYNSRIVGGQEAKPHSHPYSVALYINDRSFCGGSIINEDVILTAAHCVDKATTVKVVAGAHNLNTNEPTQQIRVSTQFTVHEDWDSFTLINDIALVHLQDSLKLNQNVHLAHTDIRYCKSPALDGTEATAAGWGLPSDNSSALSPVLREVKTPIISNKECKSYFNIITDSHICIDGSGGKGACNGDSGSALLMENKDQIGIASFGSGLGCEGGFPTAYTRVACFHDWIENNLHNKSINQ